MNSKDTIPSITEQGSGSASTIQINPEEEELFKYHIVLYFTERHKADIAFIEKYLKEYLADDTGIPLPFEEEIKFIYLGFTLLPNLSDGDSNKYYQLRDKKYPTEANRPNSRDFAKINRAILEGNFPGIEGKYDFEKWKPDVEARIADQVNTNEELISCLQLEISLEKNNLKEVEATPVDLNNTSTKKNELFVKKNFIQKKIKYLEDSIATIRNEIENAVFIKGLKINQIALIHIYSGKCITRDNAAGIAKDYGFIKPKSGEGLYQDYSKYARRSQRTSRPNPFTLVKLRNKIELLESIIPFLEPKDIIKVEDEIKLLSTYNTDNEE